MTKAICFIVLSIILNSLTLSLKVFGNAKVIQSTKLNAIEYRNAREIDMDNIGNLCADVFEGPFSWFQAFEKARSEEKSRVSIKQRYTNFVLKGLKHSMLVACDTETKSIVGFLEIGQLPSPLKTDSIDDDEDIDNYNSNKNDVSYLGNVAVSRDYRRQSIATKLIKISFKLLEKWKDDSLYAAVDCKNTAAQKLYSTLGFEVILDERDLINRRSTEPRVFMKKTILLPEENMLKELTDSDTNTETDSS